MIETDVGAEGRRRPADAFARLGVPLSVRRADDPAMRVLHERPFVLVRPDGHVGRRGDAMHPEPAVLVEQPLGRGEAVHAAPGSAAAGSAAASAASAASATSSLPGHA